MSLIDGRGKRTTAASDPLVEEADQIQYDLDAGPCLTAWRDQTAVRIDDVSLENRWPQWTAAVAALGVRSVQSVPLTAGGASLGAIKVYSRFTNAYDNRSAHLLSLFAAQAAVLLSNALSLADAQETTAHVSAALVNRDVIGQAKGVLLAQGAADPDAAFAMLVAASQRTNVKLHDVCRQLIASVTSRNAGRPPS